MNTDNRQIVKILTQVLIVRDGINSLRAITAGVANSNSVLVRSSRASAEIVLFRPRQN